MSICRFNFLLFIFSNYLDQDEFPNMNINETAKMLLVDQICLNRSAYLVYNDIEGNKLHKPSCIGNKTEGAMIMMVSKWGYEYPDICENKFNDSKDRLYAFNSGKKRSTGIIHYPDGTVRVYCKGASEWVLKDCTKYTTKDGTTETMTASKRSEIEDHILYMANQALRTLLLAHKDYKSVNDLPADWEENPPDHTELICDCVVGIIDPLRGDVTEAVKTAQGAGVTVRMVTGDNIATASAIARKCGILTPTGCAVEGPDFRKMSPKELDAIIPNLQVMARSSPDDKYLLVTRLNGHAVPADQAAWEEKHRDKDGVAWDTHKDLLLPGYREEWELTRPEGGHVVGVTGDGTNDAPALKAADVGLAMGITGTKVAQGAADIVILDDRFSSIVNAIMWGRCVYDNIRKFLQFQLTVNVVALCLCFIGAVCGFGQPLNAVQMLWVNLVMDTMGALALGTEAPTRALLERRPYKRTSSLISRPMWRNILFQSAFQLILLFTLLFIGPNAFDVRDIAISPCFEWDILDLNQNWDISTGKKTDDTGANSINCDSFKAICPDQDAACYYDTKHPYNNDYFKFTDMSEFEKNCLKCNSHDHQHGTIIFNAFIFCQFFNEYTARKIFDEVNMFEGLSGNFMFIYVSIFTFIAQVLLVEYGGEFVKTTSLTIDQWCWTVLFGFIGIPIGCLMRYFPMVEDPDSFFISENEFKASEKTKEEEEV
jgi:magnesium-transporting ATPase (P-type)